MLATLLLSSVLGATPEFTFVECPSTQKHVAVQAKEDYYLVHFHFRVKQCETQEVFARVRCETGTDSKSRRTTLPSTIFRAVTANDLWSIFLRVPRFSDETRQNATTYQIELGRMDYSQVDEDQIFESFGWRIHRQAVGGGSRETFVHKLTEREAVALLVNRRTAVYEGGEIRIRTLPQVYIVPPVPLKYGLTGALLKESVDGERATKKIN